MSKENLTMSQAKLLCNSKATGVIILTFEFCYRCLLEIFKISGKNSNLIQSPIKTL